MSYGKQYYKEYYEGKFFESTTSGTFEVIEYIDRGNVVIRFLDDRLLFKLENYDVEKEKGSLWHLN